VEHKLRARHCYVAEALMEITVAGARRRVLHRELVLIVAGSPAESYKRAKSWGEDGVTTYENPDGKRVEVKFWGITRLDRVVERIEIEDPGQAIYLRCEELKGVRGDRIKLLVPPKEHLAAFRPRPPFGRIPDPDYRSRELLALRKRLSPRPRKRG
jgi:hypothetical protein